MSKILVLSATFVEHEQTFLYDNEIHIIGIGKVNAAVQTARLINLYNSRDEIPTVILLLNNSFKILPEGVGKTSILPIKSFPSQYNSFIL